MLTKQTLLLPIRKSVIMGNPGNATLESMSGKNTGYCAKTLLTMIIPLLYTVRRGYTTVYDPKL